MSAYVLDFSGAPPHPEEIRSIWGSGRDGEPERDARYVGLVRYAGTPGHGKNTDAGELAMYRAAGLALAFVYEGTAGWMLGGNAVGKSAAMHILADLQDMNHQDFRAAYFAADFDVTSPAELRVVTQCLDGAAEVVGRAFTGIYGEADVLDALVGGGHARWGWQAAGWSRGRLSRFAHLVQLPGYVRPGGLVCDRSRALKADWGQWPAPTRPIPLPQKGFTVNAEDANEIREIVREVLREELGQGGQAARAFVTQRFDPSPARTFRQLLGMGGAEPEWILAFAGRVRRRPASVRSVRKLLSGSSGQAPAARPLQCRAAGTKNQSRPPTREGGRLSG